MAAALNEAEKIQAEMRQVRTELHQDVKEVVASARDMTDWRQYVRTSPWLCVGAAAALGYFMVPGRTVVMKPDAQDLKELVKAQKLVVNTDSRPKQGIVGTVLNMALGTLLQGGMALASQQFDEFLKRQRQPQSGPPQPARGDRHV